MYRCHGLALVAGLQEAQHPFEHVDEALRTGVDDIGGTQFLQLPTGLLQGGTHPYQRTLEQGAEVGCRRAVREALLQGVSELAQHREDRAFLRLHQCVAGVGRTALDRCREIGQTEPRALACAIAKPHQELCEDRSGVAARAVEGGIGRAGQHPPGIRHRLTIECRQHGGQRHRHVGAGVSIRDREHIDIVEVICPLEQTVDAGAQQVRQQQAIEAVGPSGQRVGRQARRSAGGVWARRHGSIGTLKETPR